MNASRAPANTRNGSPGEERGAVYMPAPQTGSPMTFMLGGVQHIVLAIGGGTVAGQLIAFRLPAVAR